MNVVLDSGLFARPFVRFGELLRIVCIDPVESENEQILPKDRLVYFVSLK